MGAYKYYNPSTGTWEIIKSKSIIKPDGSLEYTPDDIKEIDNKINNLSTDVDEHKAENASLTEKGHVQLSSSVTSTSETIAATLKAVKIAMDRADSAFTSASNGKQMVGTAITGVDPNVVIPADPTFQELADAIGSISTGKEFASGTAITSTFNAYFATISVDGLDFVPRYIMVYTPSGASSIAITSYDWNETKNNVVGTRNGTQHSSDLSVPYSNTDTPPTENYYVYNKGFKLWVICDNGITVKWIAVGE